MKYCNKCKQNKSFAAFNRRLKNNKWTIRSQCRDCEKSYLAQWEAKNRQRRLDYKREHKLEKRDLYNFYERKRKFVLRSPTLFGAHTIKDWIELKNKYDYSCLKCGQKEPIIKLTEDHILPISKGGSNDIDNIQPLCINCNQIKSNKEMRFI